MVVVEEENESGWCLVRMPDDPDQAGWVPIDYLQRLVDCGNFLSHILRLTFENSFVPIARVSDENDADLQEETLQETLHQPQSAFQNPQEEARAELKGIQRMARQDVPSATSLQPELTPAAKESSVNISTNSNNSQVTNIKPNVPKPSAQPDAQPDAQPAPSQETKPKRTCVACGEGISGAFVTAVNRTFHAECFT